MPRPIRCRCPTAPAPIDKVREVEAHRVQEHTQAATRPEVIALTAEIHALRAELAARDRPYDMSGGFRSPPSVGRLTSLQPACTGPLPDLYREQDRIYRKGET
jgi:hypothetical protein